MVWSFIILFWWIGYLLVDDFDVLLGVDELCWIGYLLVGVWVIIVVLLLVFDVIGDDEFLFIVLSEGINRLGWFF